MVQRIIGLGVIQEAESLAFFGSEMFVSDTSAGSVLAFSLADDTMHRTIGAKGSGIAANAELENPTGIAIARGELFVADRARGCVQVYSIKGEPRRRFSTAAGLSTTMESALQPDGISDDTGDTDGAGTSDGAVGLAMSHGEVYTVHGDSHRVCVWSPADGVLLRQWGTYGHAAGQFATPVGLACSLVRDVVYVAEQERPCRVQMFTRAGEYMGALPIPEHCLPVHLAVSPLYDVPPGAPEESTPRLMAAGLETLLLATNRRGRQPSPAAGRAGAVDNSETGEGGAGEGGAGEGSVEGVRRIGMDTDGDMGEPVAVLLFSAVEAAARLLADGSLVPLAFSRVDRMMAASCAACRWVPPSGGLSRGQAADEIPLGRPLNTRSLPPPTEADGVALGRPVAPPSQSRPPPPNEADDFLVRLAAVEAAVATGASLHAAALPSQLATALRGLPMSLRREAAEWARARTVPERSHDGYPIATFAGGCFCTRAPGSGGRPHRVGTLPGRVGTLPGTAHVGAAVWWPRRC